MTTAAKRVFPADVYDALELSALEFGGMGKDTISETVINDDSATSSDLRSGTAVPCCVHGHAYFLAGHEGGMEIQQVLFDTYIDGPKNDSIFADHEHRISFKTWCKRLNVVRGDQ